MFELLRHQDVIYLIYSGIALGVLLLFTGAAQLFSRRESGAEAKSRRLRMIAEGKSSAELLALLKAPTHQGWRGGLPRLLRQAGFTIAPRSFVSLCAVVGFVAFAVGLPVLGPWQAGLAAAVLGLALPVGLIRVKRDQRMTQLLHQLPDALDLMARGLRVGHPLSTSIGTVAAEMPDPIGTEFGLIHDQTNYGDELTDAFQEFAERVQIEDVNYLSASIGIQHGTGGDLARVVEILAKVIRDRIAMRRTIRAISSEGRLSAWFLSALPLVIFGFTSLTTPDYYGAVSDDPLFMPMAFAIVGFTVLNFLVLKKLVNFHI